MSQAPVLSDIQLVGGYFLECAILNDADDPIVALATDEQRFQIHNKVVPSFDLADEKIRIELLIECQARSKSGELLPVRGRFRLYLTFFVQGLTKYLEEEAGEQVPSQQLILTLISVGYSTARGLIAGKTRDTVLQGFVLPLLDVRELVKPPDQSEA